MVVGPDFGPEDTVIALAEGTQQAGQPDDGEIKPSKTLAVGSMSELMHTNLVAHNIAFALTAHPTAGP